jgi:preprotein translocase subunit SecF
LKVLLRYISLLLTLCLLAQSSSAKPQQSEQISKVKSEIQKHSAPEKSGVRIILRDKSQQKGHVSQIGDTSFTLTGQDGQAKNISYTEVDSVHGQGLSKGAKIGIIVGVVVAVVVIAVVVATHSSGIGKV